MSKICKLDDYIYLFESSHMKSWKVLKGALDKSNIYLFIFSSIKDCKSN